MDIEKAITEGIVFKGGKSPSGKQEDKVKTKAKKKSYITGLHGSGAAKMKAEFRKKRANRHTVPLQCKTQRRQTSSAWINR